MSRTPAKTPAASAAIGNGYGNILNRKERIMRRSMSTARTAASVLLICTALWACGCSDSGAGSSKRLGLEIPADQPVVELASVLENPADYNGSRIVMNGVVSGQCASLCEFFLLDGAHTATIYPQGFSFPRLERGRNVTIYALVTSGEEKVVISALGLRME
jgi:hypothetical protein